jgi:hypothetical protein
MADAERPALPLFGGAAGGDGRFRGKGSCGDREEVGGEKR